MRTIRQLLLVISTFTLTFAATCDNNASPPGQPASGPGGSAYVHAAVIMSEFYGGEQKFWLFEPAQPTPTSPVPFVIFNHGWVLIDPDYYRLWIDHIVRRGAIVLFPAYQEEVTLPDDFLPNAVNAVRNCIAVLQGGGHVQPDLSRVAVVGHSIGGLLAVNLAAVAATEGLPQPKVVMSVAPIHPDDVPLGGMHLLADLSLIPSATLMLTLAGEEDDFVGDSAAKFFYYEADQIPVDNKDFVCVNSDDHGDPDLVANHFAPLAGGSDVDALDYYGYWKLFDGLTDAAFYGIHREYALGGTPQQRFMGFWSDVIPVRELDAWDYP